MTTHLYRMRSCRALLDDFKELENQEIYFAHPTELNDPMEGLSDIFWEGDDIVWRNLFKHYIRIFDRAFCLYIIGGEQYTIELEQLPFVHFKDLSMTDKHKSVYNEMVENFFAEPAIVSYISKLTNKRIRLRRNQFLMHLRTLHPFIVSIFTRCYENNNLLPKNTHKNQFHIDLVGRINDLNSMVDLVSDMPTDKELSQQAAMAGFLETVFIYQNLTFSQIDLINYFNNAINSDNKNRMAVFVNFPDVYINQIENLVRPQ